MKLILTGIFTVDIQENCIKGLTIVLPGSFCSKAKSAEVSSTTLLLMTCF
ncbi:hypothetical protein REISMN_05185 [Rickettsia tamurae subsp. buchneri]|uniref:Uncharacterized protein n=1 Tax=Rickettsia tamurae subsp. buchneri TaxID=1462938 RepID=A0A8E0WM27_9RICK|nr:hypothetical protein REISMN_05185 [Rickettsia tamurae subsp. buchneri]